jgi:spore germination protein (amino acid permease)
MEEMIHLKQISVKQLFCLVLLSQIGVHTLTIPFEESRHSGYDAWMAILIGGALAQVAILVVYHLGKRYADQTLPQYITKIVGKPIGIIVNLLFVLYFLEASLFVSVAYSDILSRWLFFTTPWPVIIGLIVMLAAYIASSNLRSIAAITEIVILFFLIGVIIVALSSLGRGDLRHFLPVGAHGIGPIIWDGLFASLTFGGFELLLYVFPYVKCRKKKDILLALSAANGCTTLFRLLVTAVVVYNFGEEQLDSIREPMLFILRQFEWPVIQSLDILFISIWLAVIIVTVYVYMFLSARFLAFASGNNHRKHPLFVWVLAAICFTIGLWGSDRQWFLKLACYYVFSAGIMFAVVPIILLLISLARGKAGAR